MTAARAAREAAALEVLERAGVHLVPRLVHLGTQHGASILIQSWLEGKTLDRPPDSDDEWCALLEHLLNVHRVAERDLASECPAVGTADANVARPNDELRGVLELAGELVPGGEFSGARTLVEKLVESGLPDWEPPARVLCRIDHFMRNYIRTSHGMGSVDWEYAGWGDPAGDLAELVSHPSYLAQPQGRWDWLLDRYLQSGSTEGFEQRFHVCLLIRLAHWAVRCGRAATGVPVPSDRRRMGIAGFQEESRSRYERYLAWATETAAMLS